jgi:hypothetical protein
MHVLHREASVGSRARSDRARFVRPIQITQTFKQIRGIFSQLGRSAGPSAPLGDARLPQATVGHDRPGSSRCRQRLGAFEASLGSEQVIPRQGQFRPGPCARWLRSPDPRVRSPGLPRIAEKRARVVQTAAKGPRDWRARSPRRRRGRVRPGPLRPPRAGVNNAATFQLPFTVEGLARAVGAGAVLEWRPTTLVITIRRYQCTGRGARMATRHHPRGRAASETVLAWSAVGAGRDPGQHLGAARPMLPLSENPQPSNVGRAKLRLQELLGPVRAGTVSSRPRRRPQPRRRPP